ncbi:MAG TPA: sensor histidine kinase [Bryobacteraceae bacterium]|nr:sensor histidine kinase [Bryobacteraceae bacterium]
MTAALFTPAARRHGASMARRIRPFAARLDRDFLARLRVRAFDDAKVRALLAITPAARSRLRTLHQFLEQVDYHGQRLAKLNVPPAEVREMLLEFGELLDPVLCGKCQPAREQLHLATILTLENAFYRVREAETQAFFGLYRAEAEARDLDELLRRVVGILTRVFHARIGRLLLQPPVGKLAQPCYIEHGQEEESLIADPAMRGHYASYWSHPLGSGALVQFGFRVPYVWLPRERVLLEAASERCRAVMARARLERDVRRLESQTRQAEEEERRRIGRELHDEAGQSLLLLRLQLEMIGRDAPEALRPRLEEVRGVAERTVEELRRIVAALSPAVLERLGLAAALRQLIARFRKMHTSRIRVGISVPSEPLPLQIQEVIYRVAQECLQNIVKHSQATHVNLSLRTADKSIRLSVVDNGAGFNAGMVGRKPMSFGLAGMRERAALLGGTLTIRSAPGKGTAVVLQIPRTSAQVTAHGKDSCTLD